MIARVLTIAGSDSGGGAGIEADIKTIFALGGYGCTAITALTAQNTTGVFGIHVLPAAFVALTIRTVLADIGADAIKIGMLANAEIVYAVAEALPAGLPLVLDPVMIATSGAALLAPDAIEAMRGRLIPLATLVTPNLPETAALTGILPELPKDFEAAGQALLQLGTGAALIKGGPRGRRHAHRLSDHTSRDRDHHAAPDRHPQHPRHRLHLGRRHRHRARPANDADRCRATRPALSAKRHSQRAKFRRRPWPALARSLAVPIAKAVIASLRSQ